MRKVTLMLAAVAMMVSLFAVVAYAAQIDGTLLDDIIKETPRNDQISGRAGDDNIDASFSNKNATPAGAGDVDHVKGNKGEDTINVDDGDNLDTADGGKNTDTCDADGGDNVINCER